LFVKPTTCLRLILGDQLNPQHSWFAQVDEGVVYVLMEVRSETDYVRHHAQKVIAIFAAMRDFATQLSANGHRVHYIAIDDTDNLHHIPRNLESVAQRMGCTQVQCQLPDEWRLDSLLRAWQHDTPLQVTSVSSEHFLSERLDVQDQFAGKKSWLMETFYRAMRLKHAVLLDESRKPVGGQWNFDADNRNAWQGPSGKRADPPEPIDTRPTHDHSVLWNTIQASGVQTFGHAQAQAFRWPLNRAQALAQLDDFMRDALPNFGRYQDAMHTDAWRLFHALLSFALNVKMLSPLEVIRRAEQALASGDAPIEAVEGFVRQILGWREYVRGVYWANMPGYDEHNALAHSTDLPKWFWTGQTRMRCMQHAIGQSLEHAYAHHIQRLMVIGNFALLAGVSPQQVHQWYLGVYIDAFEWVELPNTLGMSQYADGGLLATKPYVSSAAYIDRMSNYCKSCHYNKAEKLGDAACPFNALYWDFFDRHQARLKGNFRLGMVYKNLHRMSDEQRTAIQHKAQALRANLDDL
jgi:deoxyribodipyrimidine photolyase-related protein